MTPVCSAGNVKTECAARRKRHRRRGRLIHITDDSYINRLRIKEGRLPQNDKECVVKYESTREAVKVGDVLKFKSGTSDDINDTFKDTEYTVVGVVYSPCFVSYDLGSSDIGNGNISYCVYVGDDEFKNDYYIISYIISYII